MMSTFTAQGLVAAATALRGLIADEQGAGHCDWTAEFYIIHITLIHVYWPITMLNISSMQ